MIKMFNRSAGGEIFRTLDCVPCDCEGSCFDFIFHTKSHDNERTSIIYSCSFLSATENSKRLHSKFRGFEHGILAASSCCAQCQWYFILLNFTSFLDNIMMISKFILFLIIFLS